MAQLSNPYCRRSKHSRYWTMPPPSHWRATAREIETHYGMPMDIEWAISDGEIAILQARPITNLPPAPLQDVRWDPPRPNTIWMRRQIVEHMPEPLSPLFDELYLQNGLDHSMVTLAGYHGRLERR